MWRLPTKIFIQEGGLLKTPEIIQSQLLSNVSSALIVTDKGLSTQTQWIDKLSNTMQLSFDCECKIYDKCPENPRLNTVEEISDIALESKVDVIIGVGGGSSIDAAKAASMYAAPSNRKHPLSSFVGRPNLHSSEGQIPFVAIPSTCGTGSEVTWVSVLTDDSIQRKISIKGDSLFPDMAMIDCDLLKTLPSKLIAWTSMDALTHALEAYTGNKNNEISDMFAIKAIDLIFEYLPRAVHKGDAFARYYISMASTYAGMAFGNADVAAVCTVYYYLHFRNVLESGNG